MSILVPLIGLIVCWSVLPSLKAFQVKGIDAITVMFIQQILSATIAAIVFIAATNSKEQTTILFSQSKNWWTLSLVIAAIAVVGAWLYVILTKRDNVWFLVYAKPLSLILTFAIAMVLQGKALSLGKCAGIIMMALGMWFFC